MAWLSCNWEVLQHSLWRLTCVRGLLCTGDTLIVLSVLESRTRELNIDPKTVEEQEEGLEAAASGPSGSSGGEFYRCTPWAKQIVLQLLQSTQLSSCSIECRLLKEASCIPLFSHTINFYWYFNVSLAFNPYTWWMCDFGFATSSKCHLLHRSIWRTGIKLTGRPKWRKSRTGGDGELFYL